MPAHPSNAYMRAAPARLTGMHMLWHPRATAVQKSGLEACKYGAADSLASSAPALLLLLIPMCSQSPDHLVPQHTQPCKQNIECCRFHGQQPQLPCVLEHPTLSGTNYENAGVQPCKASLVHNLQALP